MKNLRILGCCISISLFCLTASAQQDRVPVNEPNEKKPLLFNDLPSSIDVQTDRISSLFTAEPGQAITLDLPSFHFEGLVMSVVTKYENTIQTIIIRSTNYDGARLTLSRINSPEGIRYTGRIISMQHGDLYEWVAGRGYNRNIHAGYGDSYKA